MTDWGGELSFFQDIHVRTDIRIDISISIRPISSTFGKEVHLGELTQMRSIKQVLLTWSRQNHVTNWIYCISTTTMPIANQLGRIMTILERLLPIMLLYALVTPFCETTWQSKNIISALPQCLWPPNLTG